MRSTGAAVVVSFDGVGADATAGSAGGAGLGATDAVVAVRGAAVAGFDATNGSELTSRFRSLCALRATSQLDSRSKNPTPRVCLNRLFSSLTTVCLSSTGAPERMNEASRTTVADGSAARSTRRSSTPSTPNEAKVLPLCCSAARGSRKNLKGSQKSHLARGNQTNVQDVAEDTERSLQTFRSGR